MYKVTYEKMKALYKNDNIFNVIYFVFLFIIVFNDGIGNSVIPNYDKSYLHDMLLVLSMGLALLNLFRLDYRNRNNFLCLVLVLIGLLGYFFGSRTGLLLTVFASILGNKINVEKILKFIFFEKLFIFIFIVSISLFGLIEGREVLFNFGLDIEKSITLGYEHANTFAATVGILILLFISINRKKLSNRLIFIISFIEIITYFINKMSNCINFNFISFKYFICFN